MSIHISCDMYLRHGLHVQIRLYYVLPYKAKISAQHGIGFILDRCIVYLGLTMPNLQKKRVLIFEIFNIEKCTLFFFGTEYTLARKGKTRCSFRIESTSRLKDEKLCFTLKKFFSCVFLFKIFTHGCVVNENEKTNERPKFTEKKTDPAKNITLCNNVIIAFQSHLLQTYFKR